MVKKSNHRAGSDSYGLVDAPRSHEEYQGLYGMFNWEKPNILSWLVCKSGPDMRSMFEPFLQAKNGPNNITDCGSTAESSVKTY